MADGLLDGFGGLAGIEGPREVQPSPVCILDLLMGLERIIVNRKLELNNIRMIRPDFIGSQGMVDCYVELYTLLKKTELKDLEFTEKDLESFILAKTNSDYDFVGSVLLGLYSGALLHLLTERNNAKGKRTRIYVNGNGERFPYLFMHTQVVDELIIANFNGEHIGTSIGSKEGGNANLVVAANIVGDSTLYNCGGSKGYVHSLISINNRGNNIALSAASGHGKADFILIVSSKGNKTGGNLGAVNGVVDLAMIVGNNGDNVGESIGNYNSKINQVIIADNEGNRAGNYLCTHDSNVTSTMIIGNNGNHTLYDAVDMNSIMGLVVIANLKGKKFKKDTIPKKSYLKKTIHKLVMLDDDVVCHYLTAKTILKGRAALQTYSHIKQIYPVDKMIELAHQMNAQQVSSSQMSPHQIAPKQIGSQQMTYQQIDEAIRTAEIIYGMHKRDYPQLESWIKK